MSKDKDRDRALHIVRQEGPVTSHIKDARESLKEAERCLEEARRTAKLSALLALGCIALILWILIFTLLDVAGVL